MVVNVGCPATGSDSNSGGRVHSPDSGDDRGRVDSSDGRVHSPAGGSGGRVGGGSCSSDSNNGGKVDSPASSGGDSGRVDTQLMVVGWVVALVVVTVMVVVRWTVPHVVVVVIAVGWITLLMVVVVLGWVVSGVDERRNGTPLAELA